MGSEKPTKERMNKSQESERMKVKNPNAQSAAGS